MGGGPAAPQGDGFAAVTAPKSSWADEMDDYDDSPRFSSGRSETIVLPTAPRAARGLDIDEDRIPNAPPYTAYIANLSYDVDVEEIMEFFGKLKVRFKIDVLPAAKPRRSMDHKMSVIGGGGVM